MAGITLGVVADDITGSNDIGIMVAKAGYRVHIVQHDVFDAARHRAADVIVLNTDSRLDSAELAYDKVARATRALAEAGCDQFFNKTCSVFRGNIGAEFDAMLDALGQSFAVVVLGFPRNGRTTIDAIHYVRGVPLENSEFRNDPVHPMRRSNLVDILSAQTRRPVGHIDHRAISAGWLGQALVDARERYAYVILDVADQRALELIAAAVHDCPVLCGSSALAEVLPAYWPPPPAQAPLDVPLRNGLGVLCAAGSLTPQTRAQTDYWLTQGWPAYELDVRLLVEPASRAMLVAELIDCGAEHLLHGRDVLIYTSQDDDARADVLALAEARGLSKVEVSRLISTALSDVVAAIVEHTGVNRLLVAGGETSADICRRLGIQAQAVYQEIQPGLPSCLSLDGPPMLLVLKSGSFGSPDFFERALEHLKQA